MADINHVVLSGRLASDVEINDSGKVARGSLAVTKWGGEEEVAQFLDFKILGERAGKLAPSLTKGLGVTISGDLNKETWEKDGQKRSAVIVYVRDLVFGARPKGQEAPQASADVVPTDADLENISIDDIPF